MPLPGLRLLLGYCNYSTIHRSPYMSANVLIENTCKYSTKWPRTRAWHCVAKNRESKGTGQRYELHSGASISGHSTSVTVLASLKKEEEEEEEEEKELVQNSVLAVFGLAT